MATRMLYYDKDAGVYPFQFGELVRSRDEIGIWSAGKVKPRAEKGTGYEEGYQIFKRVNCVLPECMVRLLPSNKVLERVLS